MGKTMKNLNYGILNRMPMHLPPAEEQAWIVAGADQLMALRDKPKVRLGKAQTIQMQLADTIFEKGRH